MITSAKLFCCFWDFGQKNCIKYHSAQTNVSSVTINPYNMPHLFHENVVSSQNILQKICVIIFLPRLHSHPWNLRISQYFIKSFRVILPKYQEADKKKILLFLQLYSMSPRNDLNCYEYLWQTNKPTCRDNIIHIILHL